MTLHLGYDDSGNAILERDPLALLIGMLLDQQVVTHRDNGLG